MSVQSPTVDSEEYEEENSCSEDTINTDEKCRLCLKGNEQLIPVQNGENLEGAVNAVALKIDILTTVKVAPTDKICTVCRLKVKRFYSFRVMCLRSDARIRGVSIKNEVTVSRPEPADLIRSYKRQRRGPDDPLDIQRKSGPDGLSITPVSHIENGSSMAIDTKLGSGLTISAVPVKREEDNNLNGYTWDNEMDNGNMMVNDSETKYPGDDGADSQGEETENLEVSVDPFMLMEDYASDHANYRDQQSQQLNNSAVNVRGQILYPVLGNNAQIPPIQFPPHRPGPLTGKNSKDRERALELIQQMTAVRSKSSSALDGSYLDKPFKCDVCPESFSYYKSFLKHKQRHTGELEPFKCEFCPDQFQTSRQLQNHLKYHNVEKAFPCDQCERSFPTKERLNSHYTLHTGNKPYVCEICNKSFAYKSSYGLHIRKQHGEQPLKSQSFKCDKCHQEFDIFIDFKRHLRTHEGEKPFTCNVCDKSFASKSILNVHSRIHNGMKPYKCDVCGQAFTQKQSLDYHLRRHNDENPFKCEFCGMTFQRRYFLEKHRESQHGAAPSGSYSGTSFESSGRLMGHEEDMNSSKQGDDDYDDDDGDSDPLKLEIDETPVKLADSEEQECFSVEDDMEPVQ